MLYIFGQTERNTMKISKYENGNKETDKKINILRMAGDKELFLTNGLMVNWHLSKRCNYKCSYCHTNIKSKDHVMEKLKNLITCAQKIRELDRPWYVFTLAGKEPTANPELLNLIQYLGMEYRNRLRRINIITNFSKRVEFYEKIAQKA